MRSLKRLSSLVLVLLLSVVLYACNGDKDLSAIDMRVNDGYVQWRMDEDSDWKNLVSLDDLKGEKGLGIKTIKINNQSELVIEYDDGKTENLGVVKGKDGVGLKGIRINENGELVVEFTDDTTKTLGVVIGKDGREVELRTHEGYIQWKYDDEEEWKNLVALDELSGTDGEDGVSIESVLINDDGELVVTLTDGTESNLGVVIGKDGENGKDGVSIVDVKINEDGQLIIELSNEQTINVGQVVGRDGKDGREVELKVVDGNIVWKYTNEDEWQFLISLEDLVGEQGEAGLDGLSAFEIYKKYYPEYEGTEEEWIDDLINGRLGTVDQVEVTFDLDGGVLYVTCITTAGGNPPRRLSHGDLRRGEPAVVPRQRPGLPGERAAPGPVACRARPRRRAARALPGAPALRRRGTARHGRQRDRPPRRAGGRHPDTGGVLPVGPDSGLDRTQRPDLAGAARRGLAGDGPGHSRCRAAAGPPRGIRHCRLRVARLYRRDVGGRTSNPAQHRRTIPGRPHRRGAGRPGGPAPRHRFPDLRRSRRPRAEIRECVPFPRGAPRTKGARRPAGRGRLRRRAVRDPPHRGGGGDGQPRPAPGADALDGRAVPGSVCRGPRRPCRADGGGGGGGRLAHPAARGWRGSRGSSRPGRPRHLGPVRAVPHPS